jgi:hypothetical protein
MNLQHLQMQDLKAGLEGINGIQYQQESWWPPEPDLTFVPIIRHDLVCRVLRASRNMEPGTYGQFPVLGEAGLPITAAKLVAAWHWRAGS